MTEKEAPSPEFVAAYMAACANRSADWNEIGYWYARHCWDASRQQALEEAEIACIELQGQVFGAQTGVDQLADTMLRQISELGCGECARAIRSLTTTGGVVTFTGTVNAWVESGFVGTRSYPITINPPTTTGEKE